MAPSDGRSPYPLLFSPITIGSLTLRNRVVFASVFSGLVRDGKVTPELIDFQVSRARGGCAMIVTEAFSMWGFRGPLSQARVHGQSDMSGFERLAEAIAAEGCHPVGQITEQGRGDMRPARRVYSVSASARPDDMSWTMPHAMTPGEIDDMIGDMVDSSAKLQAAGFRGIEISAGHGHIFHQFMSPWMNRREDDYGGSFENRMRLVDRLVSALRSECGGAFVIGIRLPGNDGLPDSIDWEYGTRIADWVTRERAVDYVNFVQGAHAWTLHQHLPDMHGPRGPYLDQISILRQASHGVPTGATGRILEPAQAETLLGKGQADFVMLGRTLIADPAWALKSQQDRDWDIRKCVSCNNCWGESVAGRPTACDNNPRVGRKDEADWHPAKANRRKRVVVVGGGVAGLEAAWIAAERGHEVTLFSASAELGGKIRLFSQLPDCEAVSSIFDYQIGTAQRAGVSFELGQEAALSDVLAIRPDHVVLATGGRMMWPEQIPDLLREEGFIPDLYETIRTFLRHRGRQPGTAVLYDFDGTEVTYSTVEMLAGIFERTVIVTPVESIARDEPSVKRQAIYRRLMHKGVEVASWSEPSPQSQFEDGVFFYRNLITRHEVAIKEVELFTYATPRVPRDELADPLAQSGIAVTRVGDALISRSIISAVRDGHDAGVEL